MSASESGAGTARPDAALGGDFALVMRCIQKILTMPAREHTHVPTSDLKAFARLVTSQLQELGAQEAEIAALRSALAEREAECERLRIELDSMTKDASVVHLIESYCFSRNIRWRRLIDEIAASAAVAPAARKEPDNG